MNHILCALICSGPLALKRVLKMITRPEVCGFYSITEDGVYEPSTNSLRYFIMPRLPIDLNRGIENLKQKSAGYHKGKSTWILTFLVHHKPEYLEDAESTKNEGKLIPSVEYITSESTLRMIYCSATDPWHILATKYRGNIYLCKHLPKEKIEKYTQDAISTRFKHYGEMFEHNCLSEHPDRRPNTSQAWNSNTQFFCVLKRSLANRRFLFSAEIDGTDSKTPLDPKNPKQWKPDQFIQLKLNCELTTTRRRHTFENAKINGLWAQSHLKGIEKVHIGFRDDHGITRHIRCFSFIELERIRNRSWCGSTYGSEFLGNFLDGVEKDLKDINCPYTTIKYHFNSALESMSSTKHNGETEYSFLPEWYLKEMV